MNIYDTLISGKIEALDCEIPAEVSLASKVAKETSREEFEEFMNGGELPPVTLTEAEQEVLGGGKKMSDKNKSKLKRIIAILLE